MDGHRIRDEDVEALARWQPTGTRVDEVPFVVGRVLLQDFTGVPLLVDLAAMRSEVARRGGEVNIVQPRVPVDLVVDHSVQVDYFGRPDALNLNTEMEFRRNEERYRFLAWGARAFDGLRIVLPGSASVTRSTSSSSRAACSTDPGCSFPTRSSARTRTRRWSTGSGSSFPMA